MRARCTNERHIVGPDDTREIAELKREVCGEQCGTRDYLNENLPPGSSGVSASGDSGEQGDGKGKKSASTALVEIAEELYEFGVSDTGEVFAVPREGPKVTRLLRGGKTSLRGQLAREYFTRHRKAAPQQALADALLVVEGAAAEEEERELHLRVARHGGAVWLDLDDATGRAVRIIESGWTVAPRAPVLFKRTSLNAVLPAPESGGRIAELWTWLNVAPDDRPLVAAWLVAALFPDVPHPVCGLFGEQGTGKTTAGKVLVSLLDPSPVPMRKPPRDAEAWVTAAAGSWMVGLDNLSDIPAWLSDSLCRAVSGDGDVRRKLYTDADMAVFAFRRALILNGIDLGALRGDLAERMLPITLEAIGDEQRLEEDELWPRWRQAHPRLLGALLDLAASVIGVLPSVHLETKPRMADFARILAAVDQVLNTGGAGLARYLTKQGEMAGDSLTDDPFIVAASATYQDSTFSGTSAELLLQVTPTDSAWKAPKGWPDTARKVTQRLKRQGPVMRKAGWAVEHDDGNNHTNRVRWSITPPARTQKVCNGDSRDSQDSQNQAAASVASLASRELRPSQDGTPTCRVCSRHDGWTGWPEPDLCTVCARAEMAS
jgi:ParB-like chromosome segregation protein Spo0J